MAWWVWLIIVAVILIGGLIALYIVGNKLQKKQSAQKEMMKEQAQPVTMLVIDKKMLPMKDAGLPKMVMEQTPKLPEGQDAYSKGQDRTSDHESYL